MGWGRLVWVQRGHGLARDCRWDLLCFVGTRRQGQPLLRETFGSLSRRGGWLAEVPGSALKEHAPRPVSLPPFEAAGVKANTTRLSAGHGTLGDGDCPGLEGGVLSPVLQQHRESPQGGGRGSCAAPSLGPMRRRRQCPAFPRQPIKNPFQKPAPPLPAVNRTCQSQPGAEA